MNTPFWDATHLLRKLNSALPSGWEVYQITLTKDGPPGFASATGACFRPYKCGGRAGSLSTNVIPKTRMTFTVPWPLPPAAVAQITQTTSIEKPKTAKKPSCFCQPIKTMDESIEYCESCEFKAECVTTVVVDNTPEEAQNG